MGNHQLFEHLTIGRRELSQKVVKIERVLRRMRGGSQAHLVHGQDGRYYVAKFTGNPQGNRILINEWITTQLLHRLEISAPQMAILDLDPTSLKEKLHFKVGKKEIPVAGGLHLGSVCPVDPEKQAIFDFLPQTLLTKLINLSDFAGMLVIDTLLGQGDRRQAIFIRERFRRELSFRMYFIDHGMSFGGSAWKLNSFQSAPFYFDPSVYSMMDTAALCELSLTRLEKLTEYELYDTTRAIPTSWFVQGDREALTELFAALSRRKHRVPLLVRNHLDSLGLTENGVRSSTAQIRASTRPISCY